MNSPNTTSPILIAGAGPTGMTAALELARFGLPVRIIDKAEAPTAASRAIGVQARTLELMEMRGIADQFVQLGDHAQSGSIYGGGKRVLRLDFSRLDSRYNYLLFISQAETERILRERLEKDGVHIERDVDLAAFSQDDSSVTAVLRHRDGSTEEYKSSYLIDAEGAHSIVRTTLGLKFEGKTFDQSYILSDLYLDSGLSDTEFHIFSSEHGFMGLFPLGHKRFRLIADHPPGGPHSGSPALGECQSIYNQRSHIPARFHDMSWSSYFHINSRMVPHLRTGRVFLGGDAAHVHSPAGGQGMNTGIQDMINLGWKLAYSVNGYGTPQLLDTYEADRIPVMRDVLQKTEGLTGIISSENRVFRTLFNHLALLIGEIDVVQENSTERISQLAVNYRKSPLSEDHGPHHGVRAGDRVPDVSVQLIASSKVKDDARTGQTARLFELLDPCRFTLLIAAGGPQSAGAAKIGEFFRGWSGQRPYIQLFHISKPRDDVHKDFARTFGELSSSEQALAYLIRPDGYIGFRGGAGDIDRLDGYLNRWFGKQQAAAGSA
jgi:2-polyprenyl-6-methoxyphenol hydroxylase-like FAD-dependent oxidoreductase